MDQLTMLNGNRQQYTVELPKLVILEEKYNETAIEHIYENTGLLFKGDHNMEAQPHRSEQIVKLFLTYNFKTQYHNNNTSQNTLFLKSDHHVGFQIDSVCYDCCKENHVHLGGLKQGDRLAC